MDGIESDTIEWLRRDCPSMINNNVTIYLIHKHAHDCRRIARVQASLPLLTRSRWKPFSAVGLMLCPFTPRKAKRPNHRIEYMACT